MQKYFAKMDEINHLFIGELYIYGLRKYILNFFYVHEYNNNLMTFIEIIVQSVAKFFKKNLYLCIST